MNKKGFAPIIIVLIITFLAAGGITSYTIIKNRSSKLIGGDTDSHGCLIAAGYSWCEAKQKCLRTWEEPCEETTITILNTETTVSTTITTKMFECGDSVTFSYKGELVTYGTVKNPTTNECWLDRNLGASRVATTFNDSQAYGDWFQWGRGDDSHQNRDSGITSILSLTDNPGHSNFINAYPNSYDWRSSKNNNLWQGVSGINNPCPLGWRLPTSVEWDTERLSWSSNNAAGAFVSPLKLTVGGSRIIDPDKPLFNAGGYRGNYWTSTAIPEGSYYNHSYCLNFSEPAVYYEAGGLEVPSDALADAASVRHYYRSTGFSVRCLKD